MDLLQSVRKDGSRQVPCALRSGGRSDFKWEDVKNSNHRENYLGHSLMAPVGRWQKGKDLTWYSKSDDPAAARAARAEEIRKIKEAEEEAMAVALGLPVPARAAAANNANLTPLGAKETSKQVKSAVAAVQSDNAKDENDIGTQGVGRGIGYRRHSGDAGSGSEMLGSEHSGEGGLRGSARTRATPRDDGDRDRDKQRERRRALDRDRRRDNRSRSRSRSPRRHRHHHRSHRHRDEDRERDREHRRYRHHDNNRHGRDHARDRSRNRHPHHRRDRSHDPPREERRYRRERTPERPRSRDSYRR
ncbi:uncharacterized protein K452DRAFT_302067 [Aplosporella prunicola CBS 121167]|uniref:Multiple myeloma tumor-associated protein 2-like N-terminal domain-containing protein n=1 Tax=Aplosporella prunicola CBS 121167 TaxID=1176127 RepID=A0A6A6B2R5_9PEZI|nr:uncharacterized protein K452DRAFT_302067 [Aplosporella prunicola CBS 121167]KAF2137307.1 hypothetical protein K452DRAFT_302067 [Aplosporella prunicola CBS 121167]